MPWVTFGCRDILGVATGIGANIKDENYFAHPCGCVRPNLHPGRATTRECRQMEAQKRRRIKLKGRELPLTYQEESGSENYCFVPVKVPSPNCPSDTLPLIVLPSVLPEYFTARLPAWPSTL
jgi:hypothetical protein